MHVGDQLHLLLFRPLTEQVHRAHQQLVGVQGLAVDVRPLVGQLRVLQHVVDDLEQAFAGVADAAHAVLLVGCQRRVLENLGHAENAAQRGAHVMAHARQGLPAGGVDGVRHALAAPVLHLHMQVLVVLDAQAGGLDEAGQVDGDHHAQAQVHVALHQAEHGQAAQHHRAAHQQAGKEIQGAQRHLAVPGLVAQGHQQSGGGQAQPEGGGQGTGDRQPGHRHQEQQCQQRYTAQQAVQQRRVVAAVHEGAADATGADDRQQQAAHLQLRQPAADQ